MEIRESRADAKPSEWVDSHGDALFRFAMARVRDRETAEELVQETFLAALKGVKSFSGQSSEKTWLMGILKHKIVDWFRQKIRRSNREEPTSGDPAQLFNPRGHWKNPVEDWLPEGPVRELVRKEFREALTSCLSKLPSTVREAFVLRHLDEREPEEVCTEVGVTPNYYWVLLHRARTQLWQCLSASWFADSEPTKQKARI